MSGVHVSGWAFNNHGKEAGYWYPPTPADTDWDKYYNDYELYLDGLFKEGSPLVEGKEFDVLIEDEEFFQAYLADRFDYDGDGSELDY